MGQKTTNQDLSFSSHTFSSLGLCPFLQGEHTGGNGCCVSNCQRPGEVNFVCLEYSVSLQIVTTFLSLSGSFFSQTEPGKLRAPGGMRLSHLTCGILQWPSLALNMCPVVCHQGHGPCGLGSESFCLKNDGTGWLGWFEGTVPVLTCLQCIHLRVDPKYSRKCWVRLGDMTLAEEPLSEVVRVPKRDEYR